MSTKRNKLFTYIKEVIKFCEEFSKWKHEREEEMKTMMDIKDEADNFNQCERKNLSKTIADRRYEQLEKKFDKSLIETLEGLDNLRCLLDTVANLAQTSLNVFIDTQLLQFPEEINLEYVRTVFAAAHLFHPQLLEFKADVKNLNIHKPFEDPKLENVKAMKDDLDRYIEISEKIFDCLGKSFISNVCLKMKTVDDQNMESPEDGSQDTLNNIDLLDKNRKKLQEALRHYTTDTLTYIKEVIKFCEEFSKWKSAREEEMKTMMDIKDRADKLNINFSHVIQAELPKTTADNSREELEKELDEVLTETLEGLKNLSCFLDAVRKLAVTSMNVFTDNQLLQLPEEITLEHVQILIAAARLFCPLLLVFKTDPTLFFLPKFQNVEVLACQLNTYIETSQKIFECFGKSFISKSCLEMKTVEDQNVSIKHTDHIKHLNEIRLDPNLRMVFLFQKEPCTQFINEFNKQKSEMLEFLNELEQCAVQLDNMDKGAKISSVAGSSVGAVGGVLSIAGLALAPFTAGVSLALTLTGVGLGITSAVNSVVTTGTEIGVNFTQQKKVNEIFEKFMIHVQELQNCLLEAATQPASGVEVEEIEVALRIAAKAGTVGKGIDYSVSAARAAGRLLEGGKGLRNASSVVSDIPHIGQAAVKTPLALSKIMRGLFIAGNVLFVGMDIFFIYKDSKSLAKGGKTEVSQFVRARAALLHLEFDSWQKIHDSLEEGLKKLKEKRAILENKSYY